VAFALLLNVLAIATLDTAFWHFRRYQIPQFALLWLLAPFGISALLAGLRLPILHVAAASATALTIAGGLPFLIAYAANIGYVASQPLQMARWLSDNAPLQARVAVHDVGAMRYLGGRTTLDIVGLTTPGAADYWRNGPGSVGEWIDSQRPDLIASYGVGHGLGLGYLEATDLYADVLAVYPVDLDPRLNVALAAPTQGIFRPDFAAADRSLDVQALPQVSTFLDGLTLVDQLDVADVSAERQHQYRWNNAQPPGGFPTEFQQYSAVGCSSPCEVMDGGRRISGRETFTLAATADAYFVLVTRLHGQSAGGFTVSVGGQPIAHRIIPELPGAFLELAVAIPASLAAHGAFQVEIIADPGSVYQPYMHWLFGGDLPAVPTDPPLATFQDGAIRLDDAQVTADGATLSLTLDWSAAANQQPAGAWKLFVHVLDDDGRIVLQEDRWPGHNALLPANWVSGVIRDQIDWDINALPTGRYRVMLGLYDPVTFERLAPTGADDELRLPAGEFTVHS
jgi:hypothetical protein